MNIKILKIEKDTLYHIQFMALIVRRELVETSGYRLGVCKLLDTTIANKGG